MKFLPAVFFSICNFFTVPPSEKTKKPVRFAHVLIIALFLFPSLASAQSWSGILSSSRAPSSSGWSTAGLPGTITYGSGGSTCNGTSANCTETTANPWTPPTTRVQCGSTISSGASPATISAAIAACLPGTYVLLGPGTFTVSGTEIRLVDTSGGTSHNGTTLRGSGAQSTKIVLTGSTGQIVYGNAWSSGNGTWTAGFSQGATSLTLASPLNSGSIFSAGQLVNLTQCQSGFSGNPCTGTVTDNGGVFLCGGSTSCANQAGNNTLQSQTVRVTSITGSGPWTVNFSPGLYMANWSANGGGALVNWIGAGSIASPSGIGLEDVTVDMTAVSTTENFGIQMTYVYASWMKGVRIVGSGEADSVEFQQCKNSLIINTYFDNYSYTRGDLSLSLQEGVDSDNLVMNNIMLHGLSQEWLGSNEDDILAYNYIGQTHTLYYEANPFQHTPGSAFTLYEGNETGHITDDDTWGSGNLNDEVRNYMSGVDQPYILASSCAALSCVAMKVDGFHRFNNMVANAIGSSLITNYQAVLSTPTNGVTDNAAFRWSADTNDPLTFVTALRWGNVDTATGAAHFCGPGASGFTSAPCNSASATGLSATESGNTVTVVSTLNPMSPSTITMTGCTPSTYNGNYMVTLTSGTSFQYVNPTSGLGAAAGCTATTGTEVPTALIGNASAYSNSTPANTNIPCSFFLAGYNSATTCTPLYSGGTGLSFWKVCTAQASFPYSTCSASSTPAFPIAGPDISGGPYVNGYAYDNPAYIAFINLPVDSAYQQSFSISSSSWSAGTETITVTGYPSCTNGACAHIMGGFQITGASACNSPAGTEFVMTGSSLSGTTATVQYALASNPGTGACNGGTMLFPDVKQFDERIFSADSSTPTVANPTFSPVGGAYGGTQTVTISTLTGGATICYTNDGSTPTTNGAGTCTHGTTYSTAITVSTSQTLKAIGTLSGDTDSSVVTAVYTINAIDPAPTPTMFAGSFNRSGAIAHE